MTAMPIEMMEGATKIGLIAINRKKVVMTSALKSKRKRKTVRPQQIPSKAHLAVNHQGIARADEKILAVTTVVVEEAARTVTGTAEKAVTMTLKCAVSKTRQILK